ncbi:MAG: glycosyl transferase family 4 [Sideroxydans sp.]|nr:glycosyl transferase family 4 [Sideroxydans sp.]
MSLYSPAVAFITTCLVILFIIHSRFSKSIQDIPNERSLHTNIVPRTGGIGLFLGVVAGWSLMLTSLAWWLVIPLLALFAISILDDMHNLSVKARLLAHMGAAAILVLGSGVMSEHGLLIAVALFFFAVWMINLYNFMDGSDGLAGGMALFGFASYGIAALFIQDDVLAWANFTIAAAAVGFLLFNFHPAKIFMGDAGSIPLGFLAVAMGVWGVQKGDWSVWFPLIVFAPFIIDASVTLMKRSWRGAKITEAHREHYYQRAVQLGVGHRNVALLEYGLMTVAGGLALLSQEQSFPWQALLACSLIAFICMVRVDTRWKNQNRAAL